MLVEDPHDQIVSPLDFSSIGNIALSLSKSPFYHPAMTKIFQWLRDQSVFLYFESVSTLDTESNDSRKIICLRKYEVYV